MVPAGPLHMRPFQCHLKEHWRYPQSLDSLLPWTETISAHLNWWQNSSNVMIGADLHPKDHSIQLLTDASNEGWGAHLDQSSTKGLWSDWEKRLHINGLPGPAKLQGPVPEPNNASCDNSTVVAYINISAGVQTDLPKVVHTSCRPICHSSEPQTSTVRISCPRPKGLGHRCSEHKLDGSHCLYLPSNGSPS